MISGRKLSLPCFSEVVGVGDWGKNLMKKRNSKLKMENQKKGRKKRKIYNTSGDILIVKIFH